MAVELLRVPRQCGFAGGRFGSGFRIQIRRQRNLGVDSEHAAAWKAYQHIRTLGRARFLLVEIAIRDHARQLRHPAQRELPPASAGVGHAQRLRKRHGFLAQRAELLFQAAQHMLALGFDIADVGFNARQRVGNRTRGVGCFLGRLSGSARAEPGGGDHGGECRAHNDRHNNSGHECSGGERHHSSVWHTGRDGTVAVDADSRKGA